MKTINNCIHFGLKMILYFTMVLIIAVFIWSRVDMVPTHFTHYDDLYAPYLFTVIDQYDPLFFSSQLEKSQRSRCSNGGIGREKDNRTMDQWTRS